MIARWRGLLAAAAIGASLMVGAGCGEKDEPPVTTPSVPTVTTTTVPVTPTTTTTVPVTPTQPAP